MSEFKTEEVGNFGVPGVSIEQTLLNSYDPYSGIDLRDEVINQNVCIRLEASRAPDGVLELDGSGQDFNFPDTDGLNDGVFRSVDNPLWPDYIGDYDDGNGGCQTTLNFIAQQVFEVRAVCADGSMVLLGNSYDDQNIQPNDWFYESGEQACLSTMKQNSNLFFASDNDKRQTLGLISSDDLNITEDNFTDNISDLLFTQIPKENFITNGSGRLVQENLYETSTLGQSSYKPLGSWTYLGLDGVGIHLTQNETAPGTETPKKWIQSDEYSQESNSTYGYAGWAPYIYPFEDHELNSSNYQTFFNSPPIQKNLQWASWVRDNECFSFGKCLRFYADSNYGSISSNDNRLSELFGLIDGNQYRTNNQAQKIYSIFDEDNQTGDTTLNPYSSLEVKFKMKTTTRESTDLNTKFIETGIIRNIDLNNPKYKVYDADFVLFGSTAPSINTFLNHWTTTTHQNVANEADWDSEMSDTIPPVSGAPSNAANYGLHNDTNQWIIIGAYRGGDLDQDDETEDTMDTDGEWNLNMDDDAGYDDDDESHNFIQFKNFRSNLFRENSSQNTHDEIKNLLDTAGTFNNYYLQVGSEMLKIISHRVNEDYYPELAVFKVQRGVGGTTAVAHSSGETVRFYSENYDLDQLIGDKFYETNYQDLKAAYNSITSTGVTGNKSFGSMNRFRNSEFNKWEEFSYTFNLVGDHVHPDDLTNVRNLNFVIQTSSDEDNNGFHGEVFIDDIEVKESYKFTPDVDVRKKKGPNEYGIADLTKYYDKDLQPNEYEDSTAPLEAQFYFYPRYNYNDTFGFQKAIIHNDFRQGMFYIYDVDWGDGSPKEFESEPIRIDEETSLYHTYETNGIFEVTGTMIRMKPDKNHNPLGIIHHRKFQLFININEKLDEDFLYFGTNGFSFIPFRNTLPVVGGYGEQSIYYKSIKRQLGLISDDLSINTEFKSIGDRLKTEIALDKMDSSFNSNFNVLREYQKQRFSSADATSDELQTQLNYFKNFANDDPDIIESGLSVMTPEYLSTLDFPQYVQEFDLNGDGVIDFNDASLWAEGDEYENFDRPDVSDLLYNLIAEVDNPTGDYYTYPDYVYNWSSVDDIPTFIESEVIYNGIKTNSEELGKTIGDADITNIRYFNTGSKSIWEMIGFEQDDFNQVGNPNEPRYWKKIIPKGYSIFEREGIISTEDGYIISNYINQTEQNWYESDLYYYPVLPKYSSDGKFIFNEYPNDKIRFPETGPITDEGYFDNNLKISITTDTVETNVLNDKSGNNNYGFSFNDYKPKFNQETLQPQKVKSTGNTRVSKFRGAF